MRVRHRWKTNLRISISTSLSLEQALTRAMFSYQFKDHQCNLLKTQINSMFIKARICFIRPLQYQCLSIVHLNPVSMFNPIKVYIKHFNAMYFQCQWEHIFININRILAISCCGCHVYSCLPLIKPQLLVCEWKMYVFTIKYYILIFWFDKKRRVNR